MKSIVFFLVVLCTLIIGSVSWESKASNVAVKQKAIAQFNRPVVLQGVTLQPGEYLFVHDDLAMQRGEACTRVYQGPAEVRSRLVVSFHCVHVERAKAERFTVRSVETAPGVTEVQEFQFAGDTAAHGVPTSIRAHVVPTSTIAP